MRTLRYGVALSGVLAGAVGFAACSSSIQAPGHKGAVAANALGSVTASPLVEQALGISSWKVYFGGPTLVITGYASNGEAKQGLEITAFDGGTNGDSYYQLAVLDGTAASVQRFSTTGYVTGTLSPAQATLVAGAIYDLSKATPTPGLCDSSAYEVAASAGLACVAGNVGLVTGAVSNAAEVLGIGDWFTSFQTQANCGSLASALQGCIGASTKPASLGGPRFRLDLDGNQAVANAEQWVSAQLTYCQSPEGQPDPDTSCSKTCNRTSNPSWNAYRSDCSGLVSFAWALPAPGRTTGMFAPFDTTVSSVINCTDLAPGDALNKDAGGHILLFKQWVTPGSQAVFIEEPGCSSSKPYAREFTSNVTCNGTDASIAYEGATFTAIRYNSLTSSSSSSGDAGGGGSSGDAGGGSSGGSSTSGTDDCQASYGDAYNFFVGEGLQGVQSAGVVGNLIQESRVNPNAAQPGGAGRGIAQWSVGQRWDTTANDNVEWYAQMEGESATSLNLQLQFIWYELQTFGYDGLSQLQAATTVEAATVAFEQKYERCGTCDQGNRVDYAQSVANSCGMGASTENTMNAPTQSQVNSQAANTNNPSCGGADGGTADAGTGQSLSVSPMTGAVTCSSAGADGGVAEGGAADADAGQDATLTEAATWFDAGPDVEVEDDGEVVEAGDDANGDDTADDSSSGSSGGDDTSDDTSSDDSSGSSGGGSSDEGSSSDSDDAGE